MYLFISSQSYRKLSVVNALPKFPSAIRTPNSEGSNYFTTTFNGAARSPDNSTSVICVPRARRYAYDKICDLLFKYFTPKLGIEPIYNVPRIIEIWNLSVDVLNALWKKYWHTLQLRPWWKGHDSLTPCSIHADNTRTIVRTSFYYISYLLRFIIECFVKPYDIFMSKFLTNTGLSSKFFMIPTT